MDGDPATDGADRHPEPGSPLALTSVADEVTPAVVAAVSNAGAEWGEEHPYLAEVFTELESFAAGGKRLRAALCHWAHVGAGGRADDDRLTDLMVAVELLHAFALVHDDVMDDADRRRGRPTIHTAASAIHEESGWAGESRRFGEAVAIIAGDLLHVLADSRVHRLGPAVLDCWDRMRIEVDVGQWLDMVAAAGAHEGDRAGEAALAERVTELKSARYSAVRPLQLGCALATGDSQHLEAMAAIGLPLGQAFQYRDDVLGAVGSSGVTGKPVGADLRSGKVTPLVVAARSSAPSEVQSALLERIGAPDLSEAEIVAIGELLHELGAVEAIEARIDRCLDATARAIDDSALSGAAKTALEAIATFAAHRRR